MHTHVDTRTHKYAHHSSGLRRRGVSAAAINAFCRDMGITRNENVIPMHKLEYHVRAHMEATAPRALAVLRPLKVHALVCVCGAQVCVKVVYVVISRACNPKWRRPCHVPWHFSILLWR
jgi:hypothetical protein